MLNNKDYLKEINNIGISLANFITENNLDKKEICANRLRICCNERWIEANITFDPYSSYVTYSNFINNKEEKFMYTVKIKKITVIAKHNSKRFGLDLEGMIFS